MKSLHIINAPGSGGAEMYIKDMAKSFMRLGHPVVIGFVEHAVDCGRSAESEAVFLKELDAAAVPYFFIGHDTKKKPWRGAWRVMRYVKNHPDIDIYHSHLLYGIIFGAFLSIPRVYTNHTMAPRLNKLLYRALNFFIEQQVGISEICQKGLEAFSNKKVAMIANGVDLNKFKNRVVRKPGDGQKINAICVGRLTYEKNYGLLVDAVKILNDDIKSRLHITLAGEGSPTAVQALESYIAEKGVSGCITLIGERNDIPDLLAKSDLFIMSSSSEGLPIALIEAAISGLPCLVTDVGGCKEVIHICNNGFVVPPGNAAALAEKLALLVNNTALITEYSENAINNAVFYSVDKAAEAHINLYQKLLN